MRRPSSSKNVLFECASASVKFMYFRRPTFSMVSRVITFSSNAATAIVGLIVEQGMYPSLNAIFWFTTVKMRPVLGSTATTDPLYRPSASTTARRTIGSSYVGSSALIESAYVRAYPPYRRGASRLREADFTLDFAAVIAAASAAGIG